MQEGDHRIGHVLPGITVLFWGANIGIIKSPYQDLPPTLK